MLLGLKNKIDTEMITEFSQAKEHILPRLVGMEHSPVPLYGRPHTDMADLAVIYDILLLEDGDHRMTAAVTDAALCRWNITKETLHAVAVRNMKQQAPASFVPIMEMLLSLQGWGDAPADEESNSPDPAFHASLQDTLRAADGDVSGPDALFVLSNQKKLYGAAAVLDQDMMQRIAAQFPEGFYVLPSSVHELLIVSKRVDIGPDELERMVQEINASEVEEQERLSDHVYEYDMDTHALCRLRCEA